MRVQYPKCAYGPYCKLNPIPNGVYILVEVSFYIQSYLFRHLFCIYNIVNAATYIRFSESVVIS